MKTDLIYKFKPDSFFQNVHVRHLYKLHTYFTAQCTANNYGNSIWEHVLQQCLKIQLQYFWCSKTIIVLNVKIYNALQYSFQQSLFISAKFESVASISGLCTLSNFEIRRDVIVYFRQVPYIKRVCSIWSCSKSCTRVLGLLTVKHAIYCV